MNGPRSLMFGMGACYALGTFADNFYKQAAVLMAATAAMTDVQSLATVLFSLPFILFSSAAGWIADRSSKKRIVVAAKALELLAMVFGGWMLIAANWSGILVVMFVMATQSTLFSPAINGSIPENFPPSQVPRVNSLIKLGSTAAILAGMALAGVFLDFRPYGMWGALPDFGPQGEVYGRGMAAGCLLLISVMGLVIALFLPDKPALISRKPPAFPWTGPLDSVRHAVECRKDASLFLVLIADAWFYGIAVVAVISIANLTTRLGYSHTLAGLVSACLMVGVAFGSLIAGRFGPESWRRLLVPSANGISVLLILVSIAPLLPPSFQLAWIGSCLFLCGVCGGIYLIPLESYIQVRPAAHERGRIIAVSNFMSFSAMALFGAIFQPVSYLPPAATFVVFGAATFVFIRKVASPRLTTVQNLSMADISPGWLGWFLRAALSVRYSVKVCGLDAIPAPGTTPSSAVNTPGILFLPNHPALIDPVLVYSRIAGLNPRPMADARHMGGMLPALAGRIADVVTIPDLDRDGRQGRDGVLAGIEVMIATLKSGGNVLLYPAGRMYTDDVERLGAKSAVWRILSAIPQVRVVLVRTSGVWGSSFSRAKGAHPDFMPTLLRGIVTALGNLLFFVPKRRVLIEFAEPADLPRSQGKAAVNRWMENHYNERAHPPIAVKRFFWEAE